MFIQHLINLFKLYIFTVCYMAEGVRVLSQVYYLKGKLINKPKSNL